MKLWIIVLLALGTPALAQKSKKVIAAPSPITVSMTPDAWTFAPGNVEFIDYRGARAMKIMPNAGQVVLNNVAFDNGTIDIDLEPQDPRFMGIYFRRKDANESEYVYLRVVQATTNPLATDAVQYAPILKGVNLWDMLPQFQGPATVKAGDWNRVRLVVSGQQMRVYVNDIERPALHIPHLEADVTAGGISLDGAAVVRSVVIRPGVVDNVPAQPGYDPTQHDPRYLRHWQVTAPVALPVGQEVSFQSLPKPETNWAPLSAERQGLVNLTRLYGKNTDRKMIWLKTKITAKTAQKALLRLGFSDEIWAFVNGQLVFVDKNLYASSAARRTPDGRLSLDNSAFMVPLKVGENELLLGVANNFFGWGVVARFDSLDEIEALR